MAWLCVFGASINMVPEALLIQPRRHTGIITLGTPVPHCSTSPRGAGDDGRVDRVYLSDDADRVTRVALGNDTHAIPYRG